MDKETTKAIQILAVAKGQAAEAIAEAKNAERTAKLAAKKSTDHPRRY